MLSYGKKEKDVSRKKGNLAKRSVSFSSNINIIVVRSMNAQKRSLQEKAVVYVSVTYYLLLALRKRKTFSWHIKKIKAATVEFSFEVLAQMFVCVRDA